MNAPTKPSFPWHDDFWKDRPPLGLAWQICTATGWGVYGANLALQLLRTGAYFPLPFELAPFGSLAPLQRTLLRQVYVQQERLAQILASNAGRKINFNFTILHGLGEQFVASPKYEAVAGAPDIGLIFFVDSILSPAAAERSKRYQYIITGSAWNAEVLAGFGFQNVRNVLQGIDPTVFHAAPRANWFGDRFVVFSGGKLEFRKGQDLALAAFRVFRARHPDALLVTAWHNPWPDTMIGLDRGGHVVGLPKVDQHGRLQLDAWAQANGLPERAFVDVGAVPNEVMGQLLRESDVALFPNRAEGGTNLVAMESLACGVPTILSNNTGHLDLIEGENCYPLLNQHRVSPQAAGCGTDGWGESDIEEMVEALEQVYRNREDARQRGVRGAEFMKTLTWEIQVEKLVATLRELAGGPA